MKQYRVSFTLQTIDGPKIHSSQWFNSLTDAMNSRYYNHHTAEIISRDRPDNTHPTFAEWKRQRTIIWD